MIKPIRDFIAVEVTKAVAMSDGGIAIVGDGSEVVSEGVVVAIGPGDYDNKTGLRVPLQVVVGDSVVFGQGVGMKMEEFSVTMMREKEIITIIRRA